MARAITVESPARRGADLRSVIDRVLVFDGVLSNTQLLLVEQWALQTPHWMLTNSVHDASGRTQHRIWGASYIEAWNRTGWPGLPPVLFSTLATIFQKLGVMFTAPKYVGLNGQSRGQQASIHVDCPRDATGQLSVLIYVGEDTDGDLLIYGKDDRDQVVDRVAFQPNRVVAFDGSIPHQACAPSDERLRMSIVVRGAYQCW
jgi:hypothetical protein